MPIHRQTVVVLLLHGAAILTLAVAPPTVHAQDMTPERLTATLSPGQDIARTLPVGAVHTYTVTLARGAHAVLRVEPTSEQYFLRVYGPTNTMLADASVACSHPPAPCGVPFHVETAGAHRIVLRSLADEFPEWSSEVTDQQYRLSLDLVPLDHARQEQVRLDAAIAWIRANRAPVASVEAGHATGDLQPVGRALAGARVIALGEATHGTREFFQMKHRLLEYLVREQGVTIFAMEIDQGSAKAINSVVLHGQGDRAQAVAAAGMWQWETEEVAALLDWLRDYNRTAPAERRVRFAGFDFQLNDRGRSELLAFLARVAPGRAATVDSLTMPLVRRPDASRSTFVEFYALPAERRLAIRDEILALYEEFVDNRELFTTRTSAAEYGEVLQAIRRMVQFTDAHSRNGYDVQDRESGVATRDRYMAENVVRILDEAPADARVALWSHNEHVRRDAFNMGHFLAEHFGEAYYAVGFAFDRGGFRALEIGLQRPAPLRDFMLPPALQGSVGWLLHRAEHRSYFVDFRAAPRTGPAAEWFAEPRPMRSIGNGYAPANPSGYFRAPVVLGRSYDGILFIPEVSSARGLAPAQGPSRP